MQEMQGNQDDGEGQDWALIIAALETLGHECMSDDESIVFEDHDDDEDGAPIDQRVKELRRLRLSWRNEAFVPFFRKLDQYCVAVTHNEGYRGLRRRPARTEDSREPVPELPENYYSAQFLTGISAPEREMLCVAQAKRIPDIVSLRHE